MNRQSKSQRRAVRRAQRWLRKNAYVSGFGIRLVNCSAKSSDGHQVAISPLGVVVASGGGAYVEPWRDFPATQINRLLGYAKTYMNENQS